MNYINLKSPEVESLEKSKLLILIPVGSIEAHGPHLPIGTDSIIVEHFAEKLEVKFSDKIVLMPTIKYAFNSINFDYPGTLSVSPENFAHQIQDIIHSLFYHGFENFFILSSHGGNEIPVKLAIQNILYPKCVIPDLSGNDILKREYPKIAFKTWWDLAKLRSRHAEKLETELMMKIAPDLVDLDKAIDCKPENPWYYFPSRKSIHLNTYGVNGEPTKANMKSAEIVYNKVLVGLTDFIEKIDLQ